MTTPPTPDDVLLAAFVIGTALVAFIAVLYLNRKQTGTKTAPVVKQEVLEGGTVLVEEDGKVVRRSTRQHKPPPGDDAYTPAKSPRAARSEAATPTTAARTPRTAERPTSPTRGRRAAAAKSPAPRKAAKSPTPGATPTSPRSRRRAAA